MVATQDLTIFQSATLNETLTVDTIVAGDTFQFWVLDRCRAVRTDGTVAFTTGETTIDIGMSASVTGGFSSVNIACGSLENQFWGNWFVDKTDAAGDVTRIFNGDVTLSLSK